MILIKEELVMNVLHKIVYGFYVLVLSYVFYSVFFVTDGWLLWSVFLWIITPVLFACVPVIYSSKYIFKLMLPTFQQAGRVACLGTLKTMGLDVVFALLFWLGSDLFTIQTSNVAPVQLWGIAHTMPVVLAELLILMLLFVWLFAKLEYFLMSSELVEQNQKSVKKTLNIIAFVHVCILATMCIIWQIMTAVTIS